MAALDCLACLRNPAHRLEDDGELVAEFCEKHWAEFEATIEQHGKRFRRLVAEGMHPKMAERALANEIVTAGGS